jgi:hypothetical protein
MAWSYDLAELGSTGDGAFAGSTIGTRYQVRLLIQDTTDARQLLQNEEIDWFLSQEANVYLAAAMCCDVLVAKAGMLKTRRLADITLEYDVDFYRGLATTLRARGSSHQVPYLGGASIADKQAEEANADAVAPRAFRGAFDHPGASQPTPDTNESTNGLAPIP